MKSWLGRFGTCPYIRCIQKIAYSLGYEIMVGQVWNLPLRQMCSKGVFKKNHMPERASVGDGVLDVPRYGIHMQHAEQGEEFII